MVCPKCKEDKAPDAFHNNKKRENRRGVYCKSCANEWKRNQTKNVPAYRAKCAVWMRRAYLKRTFGISMEDYDRMLANQSFVCALCGSLKAGGRGRFHVDHNHKTGKIRGLLCSKCNVRLGFYETTKLFHEKYEEYIARQ